jgi:hypothetical protein
VQRVQKILISLAEAGSGLRWQLELLIFVVGGGVEGIGLDKCEEVLL